MQGVEIAKASAVREKFLKTIQELTESGEIPWLPRGVATKRFSTHIHLVTDALGYIAFAFGARGNTLQFDTSDAADKLSVAIAHQQGVVYGPEDSTQAEYAKELAARRKSASE